tara:strand:- start:1 stop:339 length:339 start_codon:yes stop_codon:yes gene_type:complete
MNEVKFKDLKCSACSGKTPKLSDLEINNNLLKINGWNVNEQKNMIFKKFSFKTFGKALDFANSVGKIADSEGHHPDLSIGWGYCLIMIHTHAINALSMNDFILASKIDDFSN